jgi:hypothetical protein
MSANFTLYVVDEGHLPSQMEGLSDLEKYQKLLVAVKAKGSRWTQLKMDVLDFANALETIDGEIGGTGFLPVFAFNNSPHDVLGPECDCPSFGYFNLEQVKDLHAVLNEMPPQVVEEILSAGGDVLEEVFYAFKSAAEEAATRGYALAIIHS